MSSKHNSKKLRFFSHNSNPKLKSLTMTAIKATSNLRCNSNYYWSTFWPWLKSLVLATRNLNGARCFNGSTGRQKTIKRQSNFLLSHRKTGFNLGCHKNELNCSILLTLFVSTCGGVLSWKLKLGSAQMRKNGLFPLAKKRPFLFCWRSVALKCCLEGYLVWE